MELNLEKAIENVRAIDAARNYWFIRTYSGALFETFYSEKFVAIGFNDVPYEYIRNARKSPSDMDKLKEYISTKYDLEKGEVTKWANQLVSFEMDVNLGDLVIIPDTGSNKLCVGVIRSKTKIVKSARKFQLPDKTFEAIPEKRKEVEWLKPFSKFNLFGDVSGLFSSHMAITNANKYSEIIESNLNSIFIKNERVYISIRINQENDINAFALRNFLDGITYFYNELCEEEGIEPNEDLFIKIKVFSEGGSTLSFGKVLLGVGVFGVVLLAVNPKLKMAKKPDGEVNIEFSADGNLLTSISDFLDRKQIRHERMELFRDSLEKLKANTSTVNEIIEKENNVENKVGENPKAKKGKTKSKKQ